MNNMLDHPRQGQYIQMAVMRQIKSQAPKANVEKTWTAVNQAKIKNIMLKTPDMSGFMILLFYFEQDWGFMQENSTPCQNRFNEPNAVWQKPNGMKTAFLLGFPDLAIDVQLPAVQAVHNPTLSTVDTLGLAGRAQKGAENDNTISTPASRVKNSAPLKIAVTIIFADYHLQCLHQFMKIFVLQVREILKAYRKSSWTKWKNKGSLLVSARNCW